MNDIQVLRSNIFDALNQKLQQGNEQEIILRLLQSLQTYDSSSQSWFAKAELVVTVPKSSKRDHTKRVMHGDGKPMHPIIIGSLPRKYDSDKIAGHDIFSIFKKIFSVRNNAGVIFCQIDKLAALFERNRDRILVQLDCLGMQTKLRLLSFYMPLA